MLLRLINVDIFLFILSNDIDQALKTTIENLEFFDLTIFTERFPFQILDRRN